MIELDGVTKVFHKGNTNEFVALSSMNLTIHPHVITVFKGPSGSGKTTLLSIVGAMMKPTSGRVHIFGREITSLPDRFLTNIRRKTFGFIFQQYNLIKGISVLENVMIPAYPNGENYRQLRKKALDLLEVFDMASKSDSKVEWLSGGEAQRIAIARALINDPQIVIADEPTAHLDTKLSGEFVASMARLNQQGKTILIASHDPIVFDAATVNRVIEFRDGQIESDGTSS